MTEPNQRLTLDAAILAAHQTGDAKLIGHLYAQAADMAEADGDTEACCFFLTQAYVFTLEAGAEGADQLHKRLVAYGREE